jgi:hypothetical protein
MLPLPHTASIKQKTGDDTQGKPTYGAATAYACRFELDKRFRRLEAGKTITADASVILLSSAIVGEGDQVTVTEFDFVGTVVHYSPFYDVSGKAHHKELLLETR